MRIKEVPIENLIPYARNPRDNGKAVASVAESIREFGFRQPIVVDEDHVIIVGHTRLDAARQISMKTVPVHVAEGLTDAQKKAYRLADNRTNENATWDDNLLTLELSDLRDMGADLRLTGFTDEELEDLFQSQDGTKGLIDPDDVPQTQEETVTKDGDVWVLGKHRLMCGDSTSADNVQTLLSGVQPHLMVTDPPYGVEYDPSWRNEADRANGKPFGARAIGTVKNDERADWREAWALFPGDVAYVWHADRYAGEVQDSLEACDFELRCQIIWAKPRFAISRGHYHWQHEPCWYAVRKGRTGHWSGDRSQTTLWQITHNKSETGHGTQKPVEAMRRPIENNSSPGQAVYEPFSGSGTTIIAAEQTGRACYAMELAPQYVDVAVRRWQEFTGETAVLESSGETFPTVSDKSMDEDA